MGRFLFVLVLESLSFTCHMADRTRERLRLGDDAVRIDFKDRPDFPFARSLDDGVEKELAMLVGRKVRCRIQVNGSPVPALRHYSGQAKSDTRSATRRQQGAKFCGNARSRLVLKDAWLEHVFQECAIRDADRTRPFGQHLWGP